MSKKDNRMMRRRLINAYASSIVSISMVLLLVGAAALLMVTPENFGSYAVSPTQLFVSIGIFLTVFVASFKFKASPILLILLSGAVGALVYGIF